LSDVILHLNFTAREGGALLREAASAQAQANLPDDGWRYFDVRHDFPDEWHRFQGKLRDSDKENGLGIQLTRNMFSYLPSNPSLALTQLFILFEADGAEPSHHRTLEFMVGRYHGERGKCEIRQIVCTATAEWPQLFVGAIKLNSKHLNSVGETVIGTLLFPEEFDNISQITLLLKYGLAL
jgi:hypothetical protein